MVRKYPSTACFDTFTFADNVTDLPEAKKRWRPVADWLRRRGVLCVGAWQRQKRGAWHLHVVASKLVPILELRAFAMSRGWGSFINLRRVGCDRTVGSAEWFAEVEKAARYIARYVDRDAPAGSYGESLTCYVGRGARVGNVQFNWVGGLSGVYRAGLAMYWELNHHRPAIWKPEVVDYIMQLGLECVLGVPGYEDVWRHPRFWGNTLPPPARAEDPF